VATYNLVQAVWDRTLLSPAEDVAVMTMHIRQVVSGAPDILPVTDQGRDDFSARFGNFVTTVKTHLTSKLVLRELRYYDVPSVPNAPMGDPVRVTPFNTACTSTGTPLPPQVALSVTFKTDHRLQWGRFYIPGFTHNDLDAVGRPARVTLDLIATAAKGLTSRSGTGACLTVFSRKGWTHHDPQQIQVDDVMDVIRRRRFSAATYRAQQSAG
jgi:hypothetical protein